MLERSTFLDFVPFQTNERLKQIEREYAERGQKSNEVSQLQT